MHCDTNRDHRALGVRASAYSVYQRIRSTGRARIPPTQLVDVLTQPTNAVTRRLGFDFFPNPTNAAGGCSYSAYKRGHKKARLRFFPESHQRSWWIVSYSAYPRRHTKRTSSPIPNPTNAVGGLFHTLPTLDATRKGPVLPSRIPPTQLVDCFILCLSKDPRTGARPNHFNCVSGIQEK